MNQQLKDLLFAKGINPDSVTVEFITLNSRTMDHEDIVADLKKLEHENKFDVSTLLEKPAEIDDKQMSLLEYFRNWRRISKK